MNDTPARRGPAAAPLERPAATARRLADASLSPNTRRAYVGALHRLDAWLASAALDDATLALHLAELHDAGRAPASAALAVAAVGFRARLAGQPPPAGPRTARVLAGYRRTAAERGRGQAPPFGAADLAAVLATCHRPRPRGRGHEGDAVAAERGRLDAGIAGLLFMAGIRRSEVSALRWADVADAADGDGILVTVRRSKTNQEGDVKDVRFVKGGVARAIRTLREAMTPKPDDRVVPLSPADGGVAVHGRSRGRRRRAPDDRALGTGRAGVGADQPGSVDHRRHARRHLEDEPDGRALLRRGDRRARRATTGDCLDILRGMNGLRRDRSPISLGRLDVDELREVARTIGLDRIPESEFISVVVTAVILDSEHVNGGVEVFRVAQYDDHEDEQRGVPAVLQRAGSGGGSPSRKPPPVVENKNRLPVGT